MGDEGNSGQIIVIGALLIAVLFVGLALVLNGAIYTENMATRETRSTLDAVSYADETETRLQRAAEEANWNSDDYNYTKRKSMVEASVQQWDRNMSSEGARQGVALSGHVAGTTEGVRVSQKQPDDFMPADEDLDQELTGVTIDPFGFLDRTTWKVSSNASTRSLEVNVSRETEMKTVNQSWVDDIQDNVDASLTGSDEFWMHFEEGNVGYRVYLFNHESEGEVIAVITKDDGSGESLIGDCRVEGDWVTVDFEKKALHGNETVTCPELSFQNDLGDHDMYWVGADEIHGTYNFLADQSEGDFRDEIENANQGLFDQLEDEISDLFDDLLGDPDADLLFGQAGDPHPFTTSAVYDATLTFQYNEGALQYERNITVTGG